jgi:hypothetical protein
MRRKITNKVNLAGSLCSIVALGLSAVTLYRVDHLDKLFRDVRCLGLKVELSLPNDGSITKEMVVPIAGRVSIEHYGSGESPDVNLALAERRIKIISLVRPLSATSWWVQTRPNITPDGSLQGSVRLGDASGSGADISFHILLIAVPEDSLSEGSTITDIPINGTSSHIIQVTRKF